MRSVLSPQKQFYRTPRPRGKALGRARLLEGPLVAYRLVAAPRVVPRAPPRVVPRVVPRVEYLDVGLEATVLGGCSTKEVSVVLKDAINSG